MPTPDAPTPTGADYNDLPVDSDRWHRADNGATVWPCPRCAVTLLARAEPARHWCTNPNPHDTTPAKRRVLAAKIAAWWEGFDAANAFTCDREHIDYGATIPIRETDPPQVILTSGGARPRVAWFTDDMGPDNAPNHITGLAPVERAVLSARLHGFADLLAQTTPEAYAVRDALADQARPVARP